nr:MULTISPECIES: hypothetical protein [unclassified Aliivibrio]
MQLLADKNGEQFLQIHEQNKDRVIVQFIDTFGQLKGKALPKIWKLALHFINAFLLDEKLNSLQVSSQPLLATQIPTLMVITFTFE